MIPGLPQVGLMELVIVLSIIMLFFGATRIPQLGRSLGSGLREFRKGVRGAAGEDEDELQDRNKKKEELEEAPSLKGAVDSKTPRIEDEATTRTEQKS